MCLPHCSCPLDQKAPVGHISRLATTLCLVLFLPLLSGCGGAAGSVSNSNGRDGFQHPSFANGPTTPTLLAPSATTIDLGIVPQAGQQQETLSLSNTGEGLIQVAKIETSCACLDISLSKHMIGPSEKILARAKLDLAGEPNFLGGLAIQVRGLTPSGQIAFSIVVDVTVQPREEFEIKEDVL